MRKILKVLVALCILAILWYLFLKPQDYRVTFEVKAISGTINQTVKTWNSTLDKNTPIRQESLLDFEQTLSVNDSVHEYHWKIYPINDSLSKVRVDIKDPKNTLFNKLKIPFTDAALEQRSRHTLLEFSKYLNDHIKSFKVHVVGEDELLTTWCACIPVKTTQIKKVSGMMANYSFLSSTLFESKIELNGPPFLEVVDWNLQNDSLSYNFCYPIVRSEKLPDHPEIFYKRLFGKKALKAEYHGNYLTSDRAWYALLNYADRIGVDVEKKPVEIFFNNPNMGGDELQWKAEIYMPIKETNE